MNSSFIKESFLDKIKKQNHIIHTQLKQDKNIIFKGYKTKTIIHFNFKITFKFRYYLDIKNKKLIYPIYEYLQIEKRRKLTKETRREIAKKVLVFKMHYRDVAKLSDEITIDPSTVRNCVLEFKNEFKYKQEFTALNIQKELYICIDDTFRNVKNKNKKKKKVRFRVINIYQSRNNKEFINQLKICFIFNVNIKNNYDYYFTLQKLKNVLEDYYSYSKFKQQLFVCGDGAKVINSIANELKATIVLDKFHCLQNVVKVFNFSSLSRNLNFEKAFLFNQQKKDYYKKIAYFLQKYDFKKVYELLNKAKQIFNQQQKIKDLKRLIRYIKFHEQAIKNWKLFSENVVITETYIQQIVKSIFGAKGRIFSLEILKSMIATKALCFSNI